MVAFDLDPGSSADIVLCCQVGLWLKALFSKLKLECFAKTSGSKGLQVYVTLNKPGFATDGSGSFVESDFSQKP